MISDPFRLDLVSVSSLNFKSHKNVYLFIYFYEFDNHGSDRSHRSVRLNVLDLIQYVTVSIATALGRPYGRYVPHERILQIVDVFCKATLLFFFFKEGVSSVRCEPVSSNRWRLCVVVSLY